MAKVFASGLVVGKFAPLHLGHEWLIQQAQAQCERLYLLSWSLPEFDGCAADRRERWLHVRFPDLSCWVLTPERVADWQSEGLQLPSLPYNNESEIVVAQ